jgi:hypothetical protein
MTLLIDMAPSNLTFLGKSLSNNGLNSDAHIPSQLM